MTQFKGWKISVVGLGALVLGACTPQQQAAAISTQGAIQAGIVSACNDANAAAALAAPLSAIPQVGAVLDYETAACGSATAISALITKAISDPSTEAWVGGLTQQLKSLAPAAPKPA